MSSTLLLVHGTSHGAWCWENWLVTLAQAGWEVHALALRNHPPSRAVDDAVFRERLRVADYAADVACVARELGCPCVVVGHSMGGIVVQDFAQRHVREGGKLAGMILVAAVPPGPLGPLRQAALTTTRVYLPPPETARELYFHDVDPAVFRWAAAQFCGASPSVLNEYSLGSGLPIDPAPLTFPKLVLTAGQDRTVVPKDRSLADYYGADHAHFPDMGHDMMLERDWRAVLDVVRNWLTRCTAAGTP